MGVEGGMRLKKVEKKDISLLTSKPTFDIIRAV